MASCTELKVSDGVSVSTTNVTSGTTVVLSCDDFAHRINGEATINCSNGAWSSDASKPQCEWSWDFNTREKLIFGTSVAAGGVLILLVLVILLAYFCCYRRRKREEKNYDNGYDDNGSPHLKNGNFDSYGGPPSVSGPAPYNDAYYAYQEYPDSHKNGGHMSNGGHDNHGADISGLEKPWMGYIPRPKIADRTYYNS